MQPSVMRGIAAVTFVGVSMATASSAAAQTVDELRREMNDMRQQMRRMQEMLERQEKVIEKLQATRTPAPTAAVPPPTPAPGATALDAAVADAEAGAPPAAARTLPAPAAPALLARPMGGANLRLIDVSMDILTSVGTSTVGDEQIAVLEGGAHDPKRRGFTLQQAELSLMGAVDPYFFGETHVVFTDSSVELEEAFLTSQALPYGLQAKAGTFLTEFGRINPTHPHAWDWVDQPVIATRLLGPEGLRNPGMRVGWLAPLPWFSQVMLGAQNAGGETAPSFLGDSGEDGDHGHAHGADTDEDEPTGIGGRPVVTRDVRNLGDLLYLARFENGFSLTDDLSAKVGASGLFGPNSSGAHGRTVIWGGDVVAKWRPADNFRGWPFLLFQSEFMARRYEAAAVHDAADMLDLPSDTLQDYGLYSQLLYGFRYGWAGGLRYEYASGSGESVGGRQNDPFRDTRHRIAPLLQWQPTEFSRLRLQYNLDRAQHLHDEWESSVWLAIEVLYGQHPAHTY